MGKRRRIGLYGGTFDPVHVGHLQIARGVSKLFAFDETLFIPAHVAPHKRDQPPTSRLHRYAMLALATMNEPDFFVSPLELETPERPYTVESLTRLRREYGDGASLFFIMGADSWLDITTWREWQRVLGLAHTIVMTRPLYEIAVGHVTDKERGQIIDLRGARCEQVEHTLQANENEAGEMWAGGKVEEAGGERGFAKIFFTDAVQLNVSSTAIRRALSSETRTLNETESNAASSQSVANQSVPAAVADYIHKYELYKEQEHERKRRDARHD